MKSDSSCFSFVKKITTGKRRGQKKIAYFLFLEKYKKKIQQNNVPVQENLRNVLKKERD